MIQTMVALRRLAAVGVGLRPGEIAPDEAIVRIAPGGAAPEALPTEAVIVVLIVDGDARGDTDAAMLFLGHRIPREQIIAFEAKAARGLLGQQAAIFQQPFVVIGLEQRRVFVAGIVVFIGPNETRFQNR